MNFDTSRIDELELKCAFQAYKTGNSKITHSDVRTTLILRCHLSEVPNRMCSTDRFDTDSYIF